MINIYKKEYEQAFEIKDENWRKKYDCKPLKIFNYEVDKTKKSKIKKKKEEDKAEKEEENKTDQEILSWTKSKEEFNELKYRLVGLRNNELKTSTNKHQYYFSYMKKLIKYIFNNKTTKDDAINSLKEDSGYIEEIKHLKGKGNRSTIISTYTDFVKSFGPDYFNEADNKTDNE